MIFTGVKEDPRSKEEKLKDYNHVELFGFGAYEWKEKPIETCKSYPIRNQNGSGMCGAFSSAKALGINEKNENGIYQNLSPVFIYNKRSNQSSGMYMQEMFEICRKYGSCKDDNLTSDNLNDTQASQTTFTEEQTKEALKYRAKNYLTVPVVIDTIASLVENGYTPILLLRCKAHEWTTEPFVDPNADHNWEINHFVPVVDATLYKGQKCLIIEDSWGSSYGANGRRILSEDFIKNRIETVGYMIDLPNTPVEDKPHLYFPEDKPLFWGMMNNVDVKNVQRILAYEGLFPKDLYTGNWFAITAQAVKKWQTLHGIMDFANETDIKKIRWGKKSAKKANEIYWG